LHHFLPHLESSSDTDSRVFCSSQPAQWPAVCLSLPPTQWVGLEIKRPGRCLLQSAGTDLRVLEDSFRNLDHHATAYSDAEICHLREREDRKVRFEDQRWWQAPGHPRRLPQDAFRWHLVKKKTSSSPSRSHVNLFWHLLVTLWVRRSTASPHSLGLPSLFNLSGVSVLSHQKGNFIWIAGL